MYRNGCDNYVLFLFIQLGKCQVKDMIVYIEPLIDESLELWNWVIMYNISRPIGEKQFQFCAMLVWRIHDAPGLRHFSSMQNY